jgi:ABC-type transport system involved in Fe-S cluster assembly fused permease/ATPase subunit
LKKLQGISVVKAFANEWYEIARYNGKIKEVVKIAIKEVNIEVLASFIIFCLWQSSPWFGLALD